MVEYVMAIYAGWNVVHVAERLGIVLRPLLAGWTSRIMNSNGRFRSKKRRACPTQREVDVINVAAPPTVFWCTAAQVMYSEHLNFLFQRRRLIFNVPIAVHDKQHEAVYSDSSVQPAYWQLMLGRFESYHSSIVAAGLTWRLQTTPGLPAREPGEEYKPRQRLCERDYQCGS